MSIRPHRRPYDREREAGSFLLEALVAILIVAFGILGLLGLEARAVQNVDDAQYRSEAVALVNSYVGQMWIADQTTLSANFSDTAGGGTPYDEFKKVVQARLPGASAKAPNVTVTPAIAPATGTQVTVTVYWMPPGDQLLVNNDKDASGNKINASGMHQFIATASVNSTN